MEELTPSVLESLYADAPEALRHRRKQESQFRQHLSTRWKEGLDRLEMLIMIAQESGETYIADVNAQTVEGVIVTADDEATLHALIALHARACLIASEVVCLLKGGFADGANARSALPS